MSPVALLLLLVVFALAMPAVRRSSDPVIRAGVPVAGLLAGLSLLGVAVAGLETVLTAWGIALLGAAAGVALALTVRPSGRSRHRSGRPLGR